MSVIIRQVCCTVIVFIDIFSIAAAVQTAYDDHDLVCFYGVFADGDRLLRQAGTGLYKGVPRLVDGVLGLVCRIGVGLHILQFCGYGVTLSDGARDIVAAIDVGNKDILRGLFTIDVHEGPSTHVGHSGTAKDTADITTTHGHGGTSTRIAGITATIDVTANSDLCLHQGCKQAQQYYGPYPLHSPVITNVGLSRSASDNTYK